MRRTVFRASGLALVGALCAVMQSELMAQESRIGIALGSTPPAVEIEDLDGDPVDLGDYVGKKPLLLEFWATWCPLCEALLPRMEAAHREYGDRVQFFAVAVAVNQTKRSIRRHLDDHPLSFPVLWDTRGRAVRAFMAPTTSYVVVLDAEGRVVYTGTGDDQDIDEAVRRALPQRSFR